MTLYLSKQRKIPINKEKILTDDKRLFYQYLKDVFMRINSMFDDISNNIHWSPPVYSSNTKPEPAPRELAIWEDTSAGTGDPTHYIVFKTPSGTVVTFASEETAS